VAARYVGLAWFSNCAAKQLGKCRIMSFPDTIYDCTTQKGGYEVLIGHCRSARGEPGRPFFFRFVSAV
jgi:hypothetical protein